MKELTEKDMREAGEDFSRGDSRDGRKKNAAVKKARGENRRQKKPMPLRRRLFISFFIIILLPIVLLIFFYRGFMMFRADVIRRQIGVDIRNLQPSGKTFVLSLLLLLILILVITALILSFWLYRGIDTPIYRLTNAAKNIRDGNLDFELRPEGNIKEIRELFGAFEEMRIRLKEANAEKVAFDTESRELISNISHDLRTPITAVKGYCEGIMDGVADTPEKMERYIRTIYNKTIEMDRLINELSFYTKISTNRIPYTFDKVSVREFYDDAADDIRDDLTAKGIEFTYENEVPDDADVIADAEQITRVISNIIGNAVKYTDKPEKKIDMHISLVGGEVITAVTDNGRGIAAKDLTSIFERFYRTDASRSSSTGGSGIGLSIVKKIIEDHSGRVWASSREGEGTTIYFALREYGDAGEGHKNE